MSSKKHMTPKQKEALIERMKEYNTPEGNIKGINEYKQDFWKETARQLNALEEGNSTKTWQSYRRAWSYMVLINNAKKKKPEERNSIEKEVIISDNLEKFNQDNTSDLEHAFASETEKPENDTPKKAHNVAKRRVTFGGELNEPSTSGVKKLKNDVKKMRTQRNNMGPKNHTKQVGAKNKETESDENHEEINNLRQETDIDNSPKKKASNENIRAVDHKAKNIYRKRSYTAEDLTRFIIEGDDDDDDDDDDDEGDEMFFYSAVNDEATSGIQGNQARYSERQGAESNRPNNFHKNKKTNCDKNNEEANNLLQEMDRDKSPEKKASGKNREIDQKAKKIYRKRSYTAEGLIELLADSDDADEERNELPIHSVINGRVTSGGQRNQMDQINQNRHSEQEETENDDQPTSFHRNIETISDENDEEDNLPKKKASNKNKEVINQNAKEIYKKIPSTTHDLGIMNESKDDDENDDLPQASFRNDRSKRVVQKGPTHVPANKSTAAKNDRINMAPKNTSHVPQKRSMETEDDNDELETSPQIESSCQQESILKSNYNSKPTSSSTSNGINGNSQEPLAETSSTSNANSDSHHYSDLANLSAAVEELQKLARDRTVLLTKLVCCESKEEELYGQVAQCIRSITARMKK